MSSYFDRPEISNSDLNNATWADLEQSRKDRKKGKTKTTDAMELGTLTHAFILENKALWVEENHKLQQSLIEKGKKKPKQCGEYKEWKAEQTLPVLDMEEMDLIYRMNHAVDNNDMAKELLKGEGNEIEKEIYFNFGGWNLRSKLDVVNKSKKFLADLKTIREISPQAIAQAMQRYNRSGSFYRLAEADGVVEKAEELDFYFVFVEKKAPYKVAIVKQSTGAFHDGVDEIVRKLKQFAKDKENPFGYSTEVIEWLGRDEFKESINTTVIDEAEALL